MFLRGDKKFVNERTLELNLINALGKLQHLAFDKEFLNNKENIALEFIPEQYFAFSIGQYNFVVHARCFCAVFIETPIAAIPNSPETLVGLSNIRGALTPVYQLHSALECTQPKQQFIFSIGKADMAMGLLIDALPTSLSLCDHERLSNEKPPENETLNLLVQHFYFSEGKLWHLLSGESLGQKLVTISSQNKKHNQWGSPTAMSHASATV